MSFAHIKENFLRLPKYTKFIGIGSLLLAVSAFLPWYADLDAYRIGDQFLGVTGPAFFAGIVILLLSILSFYIFCRHLLGRRTLRLPVREAIVHLSVAVESFFLLVLVNSVYFHPKFGVNITLKESKFGMIIAFIGAIILFVGAYLKNREESVRDSEVGRLEPLIKIEPAAAQTQAGQKPEQPAYQRQHGVFKPAHESKRLFPYAKPTAKGFLFGEAKIAEKPVQPSPQLLPSSAPEQTEDKKEGGSYMYRPGP